MFFDSSMGRPPYLMALASDVRYIEGNVCADSALASDAAIRRYYIGVKGVGVADSRITGCSC
jgi:hypothetical protein